MKQEEIIVFGKIKKVKKMLELDSTAVATPNYLDSH
jgi:hypothetical protein